MEQKTIGEATDCPNCKGVGYISSHKKCTVCHGEKRVEYRESDPIVRPPVGSWAPAGFIGRATNYWVVVWNKTPQARTREA